MKRNPFSLSVSHHRCEGPDFAKATPDKQEIQEARQPLARFFLSPFLPFSLSPFSCFPYSHFFLVNNIKRIKFGSELKFNSVLN